MSYGIHISENIWQKTQDSSRVKVNNTQRTKQLAQTHTDTLYTLCTLRTITTAEASNAPPTLPV